MRATTAGLIMGISLIYSAATLADCTRPRPVFEIPDGSSATQQDLAETQPALIAFADEVREYLHCLNGEASQQAIGKDEAQRATLTKTHADKHNAAASELTGLVSCYQAQLELFKGSGGGTRKGAADCSTFIQAANSAPSGAPTVNEVIVEASGHTFDIPGGSWRYYLVRDDSPRSCARQSAENCLYRAVLVRNDSDDVLECSGKISYTEGDASGNATTQARALVPERSNYVVVDSLAKQGVDAQTFDAQCSVRAKLPPLNTPAHCKYEVVQPVAISDYYPDASRTAAEEGPVIVEFTLAGKAGRPTQVRAVAGSLFESLDQAAVKAVSDMVMSSNCKKSRYRLKLSFQLN